MLKCHRAISSVPGALDRCFSLILLGSTSEEKNNQETILREYKAERFWKQAGRSKAMVKGLRCPKVQRNKMKEPVGAETACQQRALFVAGFGFGMFWCSDRVTKKESVTSRRPQNQYLYLTARLVGTDPWTLTSVEAM